MRRIERPCGTNVEEDVEDGAFPVFGFAKTTAH